MICPLVRGDIPQVLLSGFSLIFADKPCNDCTARQCSPLWRKFMECNIINPALSLLMKHLVFGQRQKAQNFSAFHWSPHGILVSIGQHFVTTRVVHLSKRIETNLNTESNQRAPNQQLCSYVRPAQPGPNRTRLCGPCIAAIAGYFILPSSVNTLLFAKQFVLKAKNGIFWEAGLIARPVTVA